MTFRYQLSDWTFLYLLSFGEYVEIIEPVEARTVLKEKAQKILSMYQKKLPGRNELSQEVDSSG